MIEMKLNKEPFDKIKQGKKTVEMRLYDEKRASLKVGDEIKFTNRTDEKEFILTEIKSLHIFRSFADLYDHFDKKLLGYEEFENADPKDMEHYYSEEEQKRFGVVGILVEIKDKK